jgi:hypothetical protein
VPSGELPSQVLAVETAQKLLHQVCQCHNATVALTSFSPLRFPLVVRVPFTTCRLGLLAARTCMHASALLARTDKHTVRAGRRRQLTQAGAVLNVQRCLCCRVSNGRSCGMSCTCS